MCTIRPSFRISGTEATWPPSAMFPCSCTGKGLWGLVEFLTLWSDILSAGACQALCSLPRLPEPHVTPTLRGCYSTVSMLQRGKLDSLCLTPIYPAPLTWRPGMFYCVPCFDLYTTDCRLGSAGDSWGLTSSDGTVMSDTYQVAQTSGQPKEQINTRAGQGFFCFLLTSSSVSFSLLPSPLAGLELDT